MTEILAVVLDAHRPFARRFVCNAGLSAGNAADVSTQVRTPCGRRIDLQVVSIDAQGHLVARLWAEHKTGSPFSVGQLEDYASDLEEHFNGPRQLITIVDRLEQAPDDDRWKRVTWRQVAVMAAAAGAERDGSVGLQWLEHADSPHAPADQRLLHELLTYLEEEHAAVIEPISHLDVIALSRRSRVKAAIIDLMNRAAEISALDPDGSTKQTGPKWRQNFKLPPSWADRLGGYGQLRASSHDPWAFPRVDEPAFGAGFSLPSEYYEQLRDSNNREWLERIEVLGFSVALFDGSTRVLRTRYVARTHLRGRNAG